MSRNKLRIATAATALLGLAVAAAWVTWAGGVRALALLAGADLRYVGALLALSATFVVARFVRWQYLLRRAEVFVPARGSLALYLASLPGTATPAYVGEAIRCVLLRRRFGSPVRRTLLCLVAERALDVAALALIGLAAADAWWARAAMALFFGAAWLAHFAARRVAARAGVPASVARDLGAARVELQGLALSFAVWAPVTLGLWLASRALGHAIAPLESVRAFTQGTLLGALSLMPAGAGVAGSSQIQHLREVGLEPAAAIATVTLLRALTVGACIGVGVAVLAFVWRGPTAAAPAQHFDEIAASYSQQFRPHIWRLLLERRVARIEAALPEPARRGVGLDLGCGLGYQRAEMERRGLRVFGIDRSRELMRESEALRSNAVAGSALALPFRDASLDFVYTVGVLHHLLEPGAQDAARREIERVLKPGGRLVVQETNTRNPLFRFYMGYVFPILSRIDEGIEQWIPPERWRDAPGFVLERVEYFTFLPDFVPERLLPPALALERALERSALRSYSVHYQVVLRKA